jgi:predicted phosphohydrolase
MKIRYLSDLHLEFIKPHKINKFIKNIPPGIDEICILAGDIGNPYQPNYDIFMNFINENFKKAFVIAGNHEYYNKTKTISETNDFLNEYFTKFTNIRFLNNNYEHYDNYCFIGTTLWSHITNPAYEINDVYNIPNFDYIQYNQLNKIAVDFLEDALQKNENCVVITHHVPSISLIDIKYKTHEMTPYNQWFYCDMDTLIESNKNKIKCWFYGHTHTPANSIMTTNQIPFLCNPIGYPNENKRINFNTTIALAF